MSKHFKTSLVRDVRGRVAQLNGEPTGDAEKISKAYRTSDFLYQFVNRGGNHSRVMRCSSSDELKFILGQISQGAQIIIQANEEHRMVYHRDP